MRSTEVFQGMTDGKVKELAVEDNVSTRYIYQMRAGETANILDRAETYMNKSEDDAGIQWLCASQGGFFFRDIERSSDMDFKIVPQIISQFAGFLDSLSRGLADGIIEDWEKDDIFSKLDNFNAIAQTLKMQIEKGEYDKK